MANFLCDFIVKHDFLTKIDFGRAEKKLFRGRAIYHSIALDELYRRSGPFNCASLSLSKILVQSWSTNVFGVPGCVEIVDLARM